MFMCLVTGPRLLLSVTCYRLLPDSLMYIYIYVHIYTYVYIYIYVYTCISTDGGLSQPCSALLPSVCRSVLQCVAVESTNPSWRFFLLLSLCVFHSLSSSLSSLSSLCRPLSLSFPLSHPPSLSFPFSADLSLSLFISLLSSLLLFHFLSQLPSLPPSLSFYLSRSPSLSLLPSLSLSLVCGVFALCALRFGVCFVGVLFKGSFKYLICPFLFHFGCEFTRGKTDPRCSPLLPLAPGKAECRSTLHTNGPCAGQYP